MVEGNESASAHEPTPDAREGGVEAVIADLEIRLSDVHAQEHAMKLRHTKELAEIINVRSSIQNAINGLKFIYKENDSHDDGQGQHAAAYTNGTDSHDNLGLFPEFSKTKGGRGSLRNFVVDALRRSDDFLTMNEVSDFIAKNHPGHTFGRKQISTGLKDYRLSQKVVAYAAYDVFGNRIFLNGLPEFYSDLSTKPNPTIKSKYYDKLILKINAMSLTLGGPNVI